MLLIVAIDPPEETLGLTEAHRLPDVVHALLNQLEVRIEYDAVMIICVKGGKKETQVLNESAQPIPGKT